MIVFKNVYKTFSKRFPIIKNLSFEVNPGETLVILGMSGSGKTTALKMINRLVVPSKGKIFVDGKDILKQSPIELRRKIGYAIQEIGLFPHMTVGENIAIVPRLLGWSPEKINERIEQLLMIMGMEPQKFSHRFPKDLSGGQRQRIGVARALAADPPIILMDEPFGALDPITREQMQKEFLELESKIKKTVIFVTHDIFEAVILGDRIALLNQGELLQLGTPQEIIERPENAFVEQFLGKHRFQLMLLTRKIKDFTKGQPSQKFSNFAKQGNSMLSLENSFLEALDLFKKTEKNVLPVFSNEKEQKELSKQDLLNEIINLLVVKNGA